MADEQTPVAWMREMRMVNPNLPNRVEITRNADAADMWRHSEHTVSLTPLYASPQPALAVKGDDAKDLLVRECLFAAQEARKSNGHDTYSSRVLDKAASYLSALVASSPPSGEVDGPDELHIDSLRLLAFKTNSEEDRAAYFNATSKWFQDRHYRALSTTPATAEGWREITEDDQPPLDTDVIMGCWETLPQPRWVTEIGHYGSKRGGWIHGRMKHWLPLDRLPAAPTATGGR